MTQHYIGTKQVEAWEQEKDGQPGYAVRYPDGYESWCPQDVFEAAYLPMGVTGVGVVNDSTITTEMVDAFIAKLDVTTRGKTTIMHATLINGFEIVETSSCVDPANYNEELGAGICRKRIKDRVWYLLGFLLQTARYGLQFEQKVPDDVAHQKEGPIPA